MSRWRPMGLAAVALLVALASPGYAAWAAGGGTGASGGNMTNEDVPTDEAGVVEAVTAGDDASAGGGSAGSAGDAGVSDAGADAGAPDADATINEDVPTDEAGVV